MKTRKVRKLVIIVILLSALVGVLRSFIISQFEKSAFLTEKKAADTPLYVEIPSKIFDLESNGHLLKARWVIASNKAPSIFILHGNGENIGHWIKTQKYLYYKGYSSFVFDYSGFGNSTGKPTLKGIEADALNAYKKFVSLTDRSIKRILFAHSMGASVYLNIAEQFNPAPDRRVLHGTISSARDYLIQIGQLNKNIYWIVPDLWDNAENLTHIFSEIFLIQGKQDEIVGPTMRSRLSAAAGKNVKFLLLDNLRHNTIIENPCDSVWQPILTFIR